MFTGIIRELGKVKEIRKQKGIHKLSITAKVICQDSTIGDSISVNGVCLTLTEFRENELTFEIMDETLKKTNLGKLQKNDSVNLESALRLGDKLGGHMVNGHIDTIGSVKDVIRSKGDYKIQIEFPSQFKRYMVPKGSVAVDGVSLTVGEVGPNWFSVYIIPHTLHAATFGFIKKGDSVNIEFDFMAKYAQGLALKKEAVTEELLREHGFI